MTNIEKVVAWLDENKNVTTEFLRDIVRIPSVNPWFSNYEPYTTEKAVQEFIRDYLCAMGFETKLWEVKEENLKQFTGMPGYYAGRPMHERPNLHAEWKGTGGGKSILLTGHCDVVKAGEGWTKDPFGGEILDGKMYGRGTVDMKGGLAAMIMAVKAIKEVGIRLCGDVKIGIVPDEEAGGMGILDYVHQGITADGAIMTEPTDTIGIGPVCRGILWGKILIPARAGHIELYQGHWTQGGAVDGIKLLKLFLTQIDTLNMHWAGRKNHPLIPMPCQMLVAQVKAGEYPSAYAGHVEIVFNAQYLAEDLDEKFRGSKVKREIEEFVSAVACTDEWLRENPPHVEWLLDADCAETSVENLFVKSVTESAKKVTDSAKMIGIGCHTDMGWLVRGGIPTVNYGPGNPKLAHQPDEYIELEDYELSIRVIAAMILDWCRVV